MEYYVNGIQQKFNRVLNNFCDSSECYIFVCPYCSGEKKVRKPPLVSLTAIYWSDGKMESCDNSDISYIQRCSHCGEYYFINVNEAAVGRGSNLSDGRMDIAELAAICSDKQFVDESIEPGMKASLFMQYVHNYNDTYRRNFKCDHQAPYNQSKMFTDAVLFLTARCRISKMLIVDLYRQAGMFRKCLEYAADIANNLKGEELEFLDITRYKAIKGDTAPFVTQCII